MNEEKNKENRKRCYGCYAYNCYYTKGYMRFTREKLGYCIYTDKVVRNRDTCERWRSNQSERQRLSKVSIKHLNETIAELIEVTNIIKEDIEHKNLSALARERLSKKLDSIEAEIEKEENK